MLPLLGAAWAAMAQPAFWAPPRPYLCSRDGGSPELKQRKSACGWDALHRRFPSLRPAYDAAVEARAVYQVAARARTVRRALGDGSIDGLADSVLAGDVAVGALTATANGSNQHVRRQSGVGARGMHARVCASEHE